MGKGDGRREENAEAIRANWERAFGKQPKRKHPDCVAAMCGRHDCNSPGPCYVSGSYVTGRVEPADDQREARIARHLRAVLPALYNQMVWELQQDVAPR